MNIGQDGGWTLHDAIEIRLTDKDNFLKIKETLTRIGIAKLSEKKLWQTCHILYKKGKYYIIHFKGMFALAGRHTVFDEVDFNRQYKIAKLLEQWGLCELLYDYDNDVEDVFVHVIRSGDKHEWELIPKYSFPSERK